MMRVPIHTFGSGFSRRSLLAEFLETIAIFSCPMALLLAAVDATVGGNCGNDSIAIFWKMLYPASTEQTTGIAMTRPPPRWRYY